MFLYKASLFFTWFRHWFHLVPIWFRNVAMSRRVLFRKHSCLVPALVPLGSDMVPHSEVSPSLMFSKQSALVSAWVPLGFLPSLHKRLGFVLGSTWFLFGSETWVRPGDVCLTNIHACFQPWFHLVPTWFHITESHQVVYFPNSALVPALVPLGSHMVPQSGISPSKTFLNCFLPSCWRLA